jgi:preprotein translocase subunit SecA
LAACFQAAGIEFSILHARHLEAEAKIVAEAGQRGRVTIATNMAGRGTDIALGEGVPELGGLHVICTELHDSARIDRQLIGRCARQGDPGSFVCMLSWEDDVLKTGFGDDVAKGLQRSLDDISARSSVKLFKKAQRKVEGKHAHGRKLLLYYVKRRTELQKRMGLNPYLDTPG